VTLRKFLVIPLILSAAIFAIFSSEVAHSWHILVDTVTVNKTFVLMVTLAVMLQMIGHVIRAYKMSLLLRPVKSSTVRFQFRALSIGYLFNMVLPFRLGELIRARIIADAERLSFGFALGMIIVERLIDAVVLGLVGIGVLLLIGAGWGSAFGYSVYLLVLACTLALAIGVVLKQNPRLLKMWYVFTAIFNPTIRDSARFKLWSIIYGLQRVITMKQARRYLALSVLAWVFYGASMFILAYEVVPSLSIAQRLNAAVSPYYGVSIPSGPANLGVYSKAVNAYMSHLPTATNNHLVFDLVAWAVLVLPIAVVGVGLLFVKTRETVWQRLPRNASHNSLLEKLGRTEDISQELSAFLDSYFSGNSLSRIVHNMELKGEFHLMKYFRGGSDAITILVLKDDKEIVKKVIPLEFKDRLRAQYDWLYKRKGAEGIVKLLAEHTAKDHYTVDLEYRRDDEMFFTYLHKHSLSEDKAIMDAVWECLYDSIYKKLAKPKRYAGQLDEYINKHIVGCLEKASAVSEELVVAAAQERIVINGKEYDNLSEIIRKIRAHPQASKDLETYQSAGEVHGDVTVDNILVSKSTQRPLIIDPAPDGNIMNGPVFDFGKNLQSLYCGYEFTVWDKDIVSLNDDGSINYKDQRSSKYTQLCDYVLNELAPKYLTEAERKSILFHAGALHIRRLKHQVYQNPASVLTLYAVGVKTLNDYLDQYN
jgi:hypothetical protein